MLIFILLYQATFSAMKLATRGHQHCSGKTKQKGKKRQKWVSKGINRSLFTNSTAAKAQESRFQAGATQPEHPAAPGAQQGGGDPPAPKGAELLLLALPRDPSPQGGCGKGSHTFAVPRASLCPLSLSTERFFSPDSQVS